MIRVGRITGGTISGWRRQISTTGQAKCSTLNCPFVTNQISEIQLHHNLCVLGGANGPKFICAICKHGPADKDIISDHCAKMHTIELLKADNDSDTYSNDSNTDDENDFDNSSGSVVKSLSTESESDSQSVVSNHSKAHKKPKKRSPSAGNNSSQPQNTSTSTELTIDRQVLQKHVDLLRNFDGPIAVKLSTKWTIKFRNRNYSRSLYSFAMPSKSLQLLSENDLNLYQSDDFQRSLPFSTYKSKDYYLKFNSVPVKSNNWQQLNVYNSVIMNDTSVSFCGGPIIAMEWLPLPADHKDYQILAICCRKTFQPLVVDTKTPMKCLIQLWRIDNLTNTKNTIESVKLMYSIAYDEGPIIQMKFCPSGIYDTNRLGLLAVSTNNGDVNILCLPNCDNIGEQQNIDSSSVLIIEPVLKLQLNLNLSNNNDADKFVTKIAWAEVGNLIFFC